MKTEVTLKIEVVENGLVVRKRDGNRWGSKRWVVGFRDPKKHGFDALLGGESVEVGNIVREFLYGARPENQPVDRPREKSVTLAERTG